MSDEKQGHLASQSASLCARRALRVSSRSRRRPIASSLLPSGAMARGFRSPPCAAVSSSAAIWRARLPLFLFRDSSFFFSGKSEPSTVSPSPLRDYAVVPPRLLPPPRDFLFLGATSSSAAHPVSRRRLRHVDVKIVLIVPPSPGARSVSVGSLGAFFAVAPSPNGRSCSPRPRSARSVRPPRYHLAQESLLLRVRVRSVGIWFALLVVEERAHARERDVEAYAAEEPTRARKVSACTRAAPRRVSRPRDARELVQRSELEQSREASLRAPRRPRVGVPLANRGEKSSKRLALDDPRLARRRLAVRRVREHAVDHAEERARVVEPQRQPSSLGVLPRSRRVR